MNDVSFWHQTFTGTVKPSSTPFWVKDIIVFPSRILSSKYSSGFSFTNIINSESSILLANSSLDNDSVFSKIE